MGSEMCIRDRADIDFREFGGNVKNKSCKAKFNKRKENVEGECRRGQITVPRWLKLGFNKDMSTSY